MELTLEMIDASRRSSNDVLVALDAALRRLNAAIDCILVFVPVGGELVSIYAGGTRAEHFRWVHLCRDDPAALPALAAARGCRAVPDSRAKPVVPTDRAALSAPLVDSGTLRAVVYASSAKADALRNADLIVRTIEQACVPYALAIEREADRASAMHDGLTGLIAPRAFRRLLHEELMREGLRERIVSLWFIDTDRFKQVNDRLGHRTGDAVLVAMATLLKRHLVADLDVGTRNGGDEFCALIRGASKNQGIERAHELCLAVREHDFGIGVPITASIGIAAFPFDARTSSTLLEAADAAMYHSKRNGRDRVSFVSEPGRYAVLQVP
jgi:diguanylate cyclase (GGDEF)-like protein